MTSGRIQSGAKGNLVSWSASLGSFRGIGNFLRFNLKLSHKGMILVSVPLFFELVFLAMLASLLHQSELETARATRSREIISHANALTKMYYDSITTMVGLTVTGGRMFSERWDKMNEDIPQEYKALRILVKNEKDRLERLDRCENVSRTLMDMGNDIKQSLDRGERVAAIMRGKQFVQEMKTMMDELIAEMQAFVKADVETQMVSEGREAQSKQMVKATLLIGIFFNIFLAFTVATFFSKSVANRLGSVTENTRRLARGEPLRPTLPGTDEIAHLDRVFHDMAAALAEAARKERAVIENAVDVICSIDAGGNFAAVSPASAKLWGYKPEELIGKSYTQLIAREDLEKSVAAFEEIMKGAPAAPVENSTERKDGSKVSVLWSVFWSESEKSMFCVAHDITERKQAENALRASEARVRQIIDSMPVGLLVVNEGGLIESVNPSVERIFGYSAKELVNWHLISLFPHAAQDGEAAFMQSVFEKSLGRVSEREAIKATGEVFPTELSLNKFNTFDGERFLVNILDLTERREVERLKREFVSTVSHELRTPLTAIRGSLTLMTAGATGELNEHMRKVVTIAERNTIRLIGLINDLLDLEKLEVGKLDMHFDDVPLSSVIERSVESVRAFGDQNGVSITAASTNCLVHADGDRLVQVIVNLLSNAIKFSPRGSSVHIDVGQEESLVKISVIDRGRGIPDKYKELLFQRFQQVEVADSKKRGGTGLGLAICKSIIEQHQGTIGVESEEGKGSTFWFTIPASDNFKEKRA